MITESVSFFLLCLPPLFSSSSTNQICSPTRRIPINKQTNKYPVMDEKKIEFVRKEIIKNLIEQERSRRQFCVDWSKNGQNELTNFSKMGTARGGTLLLRVSKIGIISIFFRILKTRCCSGFFVILVRTGVKTWDLDILW